MKTDTVILFANLLVSSNDKLNIILIELTDELREEPGSFQFQYGTRYSIRLRNSAGERSWSNPICRRKGGITNAAWCMYTLMYRSRSSIYMAHR